MKHFTIPMPLLNKHYKTAWGLPGKIYVDGFDAEHCKKMAPRIERLIGTVLVRRPEIIRYYANTIAHHFEFGVPH